MTRSRCLLIAAVTAYASCGLHPADGAEPAKALFGTHCAPCHGIDGRARTPIGRKIGVKDLTQSKATDAEMGKQIREGSRDTRGDLRMPAFQGKLAEPDIEALIAYAKSFRP